MEYNFFVVFLVVFLMAATSFANDEAKQFEIKLDDSAIEAPADNKFHGIHGFINPEILARHEMTTVTVTETVCEPGAPGTSTFVTVPATSVITETSMDNPAPTTEQPSPPSETHSTPSTGSQGSSGASDGETTTTHATHTSHSSSQTSVDATEAPTTTPSSSPPPPPNAAFAQKCMHPAFIALVATFVCFMMM